MIFPRSALCTLNGYNNGNFEAFSQGTHNFLTLCNVFFNKLTNTDNFEHNDTFALTSLFYFELKQQAVRRRVI